MRIKIECLPEPALTFGADGRGFEPRRVMPISGPADIGRTGEIRLGLVAPDNEIDVARAWLARLNHYAPAHEGNATRYRDWPGAQRALGCRFLIDDRFVRPVDQTRVAAALQNPSKSAGFDELLEAFDGRISGLFGDSRPDAIVVCLPIELADLRVENPTLTYTERQALEQLRAEEEESQLSLFQPSPEELRAAEDLRTQADDLLFRSFYRALKARVMTHVNPVPLQILRRDTVERRDHEGQSQATRCWNLGVSLYYKSGGLPWRPADLRANTCFVGISFHHLKRRAGNLVYASVAQAFSNDVEPFALKGATLPHDQRRDKQPYLKAEQAEELLAEVISQFESRAGTTPSRIVLHKTTHYQPEEEKGFRDAARGRVPGCDLMWIRNTPFRLIRKGFQEPWRGTLCSVGEETYLFTSGYVPWWNEYPGPHIPAPIEIGCTGPTDIRERASEILALSKMNWNNTEGLSRYPVTLSFAKRVGQLMTELPENQVPNPSYRFYM